MAEAVAEAEAAVAAEAAEAEAEAAATSNLPSVPDVASRRNLGLQSPRNRHNRGAYLTQATDAAPQQRNGAYAGLD